MKKNILDLVALQTFTSDAIFLTDRGIALGYRFFPPQEETLNDEKYADLALEFSRSLEKLPIGTVIQKLDVYYKHKHNWPDPKLQPFDYFKYHAHEHLEQKMVLAHKSYIFFIFDTESPGDWTSNHTPTLKTPIDKVDLASRLALHKAITQDLIAGLPRELVLQKLSSTEVEDIFYQYFNLDFSAAANCFYSEMASNGNELTMGLKNIQILSQHSQSDKPTSSIKNNFGNSGGVTSSFLWPLGHAFRAEHVLIQTLRIIDTDKVFAKHESASGWVRALLGGRKLRAAEAQFEEHLAAEKNLDKKILVNFNLSLVLWDVDQIALKANVQKAKAEIEKLGMIARIADYDLARLFCVLAPGCAGQLTRLKPVLAEFACANLLTTTSAKGDDKGLILSNRFGEPVYYDPFKYTLDNQHAFVFGPTGAGKSFFNGKLIRDRYNLGHTVIVLDSGGTYRRLFKALGGKYIEYDTANPLRLNPFLIKPDQGKYTPTESKVLFLRDFVSKIWRGNLQSNPLKEEQKTLLDRYIKGYYQSLAAGTIPSLTGFYEFFTGLSRTAELKQHTKAGLLNAEELLITLEPFAVGAYAEQFNASELVHLEDERLLCFELQNVSNQGKLYPLVLQILFELAFNIIRKDPNTIKFIDIEEGWSMLNDFSKDTIEGFFRRGRKEHVSVRIITQDIHEIKASPIGSVLKNNAETVVLLYNSNSSSREEISAWLGLNALDQEIYNSLRTAYGPKSYREVFIREGSHSYARMIDVSLSEYALLTSNPADRNQIDACLKTTDSFESGIAKWAKQIKNQHNDG